MEELLCSAVLWIVYEKVNRNVMCASRFFLLLLIRKWHIFWFISTFSWDRFCGCWVRFFFHSPLENDLNNLTAIKSEIYKSEEKKTDVFETIDIFATNNFQNTVLNVDQIEWIFARLHSTIWIWCRTIKPDDFNADCNNLAVYLCISRSFNKRSM